jgi:hypothetical protein
MREKKEIAYKEELLKKVDWIMFQFARYVDGVNVLILIFRSKEGAKSANNDHLQKIISDNPKKFKEALLSLLDRKEKSGLPLRIYSSVNKRDISKAIRQFKYEQLDAEYYSAEDKNSFYLDIKNRFVGSLMKPSSRAETKFLIDVDDENAHSESLKKLAELNIQIFDVFKTKNGWHIITEPFNPALFTVKDTEIKKDGMLLLDY